MRVATFPSIHKGRAKVRRNHDTIESKIKGEAEMRITKHAVLFSRGPTQTINEVDVARRILERYPWDEREFILRNGQLWDGTPPKDDDHFTLPGYLGIPKLGQGNGIEIQATRDAGCIWGEVERATRLPRALFRVRFDDMWIPDCGRIPVIVKWVEAVPRLIGNGKGEEGVFEALKRSIRKDWNLDRKLKMIQIWSGGNRKREERAGVKEWQGKERWILLKEMNLAEALELPLAQVKSLLSQEG
jgi:hypothetical protein